jgi:hypothetical protein
MKKVALILLAFGISFLRADPTNISIGNVAVVLPAPDNYFRCDGKSKDIDAILLAHVPSMNRELAWYCDEDDLAKIFANRDPSLSRFLDAQVRTSLQDIDLTDQVFNQLKQALKKNMGDDVLREKSAQAAETLSQNLSRACLQNQKD